MDKMKMAHDAALAMIRSGCSLHTAIADAWRYADAMQAEADKRKPSGLPDALCEAVGMDIQGNWQPDWSQAPEWAKWWAMDADAECFYFENKPDMWSVTWIASDASNVEKSPSFGYTGNWKGSLRERPE